MPFGERREPMDDRTKKAPQQGGMLPNFSASFVDEVARCADVEAFRDLLERRGLWLNRQAAEDVFGYLRSLVTSSGGAISDQELAGAVGGLEQPALAASPILMPLLSEVAHQL